MHAPKARPSFLLLSFFLFRFFFSVSSFPAWCGASLYKLLGHGGGYINVGQNHIYGGYAAVTMPVVRDGRNCHTGASR